MVAVTGRGSKTMRQFNPKNLNSKAKVENPKKVQTQVIKIEQKVKSKLRGGVHKNRFNQEDKVSFIVNFFTYTRHTKRSKLRFSLSHGEDKTYFTIFGPQTNISNVSNIKINKQ